MYANLLFFVICCAFLAHMTVGRATNDEAEVKKFTLRPNIESAVNETEVPFVSQGDFILRQMCESNGNESDYENALAALRNIKNCFDGIISFSQIPKRIEEAKPRGSLEEVFPPFCQRANELKKCVTNFLDNITPCFNNDQKLTRYTIMNITESILNFACERDGDYIALFIAEKGPQCISSKQAGIERCVRKGLNDNKTPIKINYDAILNDTSKIEPPSQNIRNRKPEKPFSLAFTLEDCRLAYKIRNCIIEELLLCSDKTPANVMESIFNLIQKFTTCNKYAQWQLNQS